VGDGSTLSQVRGRLGEHARGDIGNRDAHSADGTAAGAATVVGGRGISPAGTVLSEAGGNPVLSRNCDAPLAGTSQVA
jgi:hypothetical protein